MPWRCVHCGLFVHLLTEEEKKDNPAYDGLQCEPVYECAHCNDIYFCTPLPVGSNQVEQEGSNR